MPQQQNGMVRRPGRGWTERANVITGNALNVNGLTVFSQQLPMGEGWYALYLRFNHVFTVGTGTTPVTEGELLIIKNVLVRSDRGEMICNLPGRALFKIANYKTSEVPRKDAIAAASATYRVTLPIFFADDYMLRPEDTVLNTARYNSVSVQVQYGTVADLLGTVGTSTVAPTLDVEIERSLGTLPQQAFPIGIPSYDYDPPVDANVTQVVNLERSADMSIRRLYVHSSTSGTGGVPWSGVNADTIQNVVIVKDQSRYIEKERIHAMVQDINKMDALLETALAGIEVFDWVRDRSTLSALSTGGRSVLQYTWTNQGGVGANSIVTTTREMIRSLK